MKIFIANITLLTLLIGANYCSYGQEVDLLRGNNSYNKLFKRYKKTELLVGINRQGNWKDEVKTMSFFEIGIARSVHNYGQHGPASLGMYLSEEIYFDSKNIYGTKIGAYIHYLFDLGLSMIYYTDFKKANFKVRPELGVGIGPIRIVMGYNIPTINNKAFEQLKRNNAQVTIQFLVPIKKKLVKDEDNIFKSLLKKE